MHRNWFFALPLAAALVLGACGGGDDDKSDANGGEGGDAATSPTPMGAGDSNGQPTADAGLPTPTPVAEDELVVTVVGGEKTYQPTLAEFRALPTVEIDAGGPKKGVSLAALAEKVDVGSGVVTVQGTNADRTKVAYTRHSLEEVGSTSVLVVDESGHVNLYSSSLPEAEWVKVVIAVTFH